MISREKCKVIQLKKTSETTPIIDEFVCSGKDYLIIKDFFTYKNFSLSLIVCERCLLNKATIKNIPFTITELKKCAGQDLAFRVPKEIDPLMHAIKEVIHKQEVKAGDVLAFENPIAFGAQSYADQATAAESGNIFSMFIGSNPVVGEVTDFVIIGLEIEQLI